MGVMETRIRELVKEGADTRDLQGLRKLYSNRYGVKSNIRDLAKWAVKIENGNEDEDDIVTCPDDEDECKPTQTGEDFRVPQEAATIASGPSEFVPDSLMMTLSSIKQVVTAVGGRETAIKLGETIASVGGLANFSRAIELLESIAALPNTPQVAPPSFAERDMENQARSTWKSLTEPPKG